MHARLITYDSTINSASWIEAVEALRDGHRGPRAEVADSFLGPADADIASNASMARKPALSGD